MDDLSSNIFEVYKDKWWRCKESWSPANNKYVMNRALSFVCYIRKVNYLGNGSYGKVWRVQIRCRYPHFAQKIYNGFATAEDIEAEVRVLSLDSEGSQYIPKLIYSGHNFCMEWIIIMEYVGGGTLWYHLFEEKSTISFEAKRTILWQIARGLEFLHKNKLTHGDLKTDNIALTYDGHVKLLDFNNSRLIGQKEEKLPQGSMCYQAPEVARKKKAGLASDLWSYGVVVVHMITQKIVFRHSIPLIGPLLAKTIKTGNESADKLVHDLMKILPSQRKTKVSKHVFFNDVSSIPSFMPGISPVPYIKPDKTVDAIDEQTNEALQKTSIRIPTVKYIESESIKDPEIRRTDVHSMIKRRNSMETIDYQPAKRMRFDGKAESRLLVSYSNLFDNC